MWGNVDVTCSATEILYDFNRRSDVQDLQAAKDRSSKRVKTYFERHRKYVDQNKGKGKGKAIPLQAWTGPEGSKRLRFPDLKTLDT